MDTVPTERKEGSPTPKRHSRHTSYNRAALTRRATKGPLDGDDPLSPGAPSPPSPAPSSARIVPIPVSASTANPLSPSPLTSSIENTTKDFSYILHSDIYHPLSQIDIPPVFRNPTSQPSENTPLPTLLSTGHFRLAAIASAQQLTTSTSPTDYTQIFSLLYTRLACLTLINSTPLAAQEVKCLEDLGSSFYRDPATNTHLMPWELRVLAVRLQAIGYGDLRRGVMGHYDLARDARSEIMKSKSSEVREMWKERLRDLGVRVANALVEMGDMEGAGRHLESLRVAEERWGKERRIEDEILMNGRLALLYLRIGDVEAARRLIESEEEKGSDNSMLKPLLSMAEGDFEKAVQQWTAWREEGEEENAMVTQNMAVCLLYTGQLQQARSLLESLVNEGHSFHALTFNLSTMYELCTEKSRARKMELAERIAAQDASDLGWEKANVDFKL